MLFLRLETNPIDVLFFRSIQIFYLSLEVRFFKQKRLIGTPRKSNQQRYCQMLSNKRYYTSSRENAHLLVV